MTKKIIEVILTDDVKYQLQGTLANAYNVIAQLIQQYGPDARLDIDRECEAYCDYWSAYARIYGKREETDDEYAKRLNEEKKYTDQQAAREVAEYERLRKKFGV